MRVLFFLSVLLASCALPADELTTIVPTSVSPTPTEIAKVEPTPSVPAVYPKLKLDSEQKKYLNKTLPSTVRTFFETADRLEMLAEVYAEEFGDKQSTIFEPNRRLEIVDSKLRREILDAFYFDAANQDYPAVCFQPHHSLRATKGGKVLEIEICFSCSRYEGVGSLQSVSGTIVREGRRSEELFDRLIKEKGTDYKP